MASSFAGIILLICIVQLYCQAPPARPTRPPAPVPVPVPTVKNVSQAKLQEIIDTLLAQNAYDPDVEVHVQLGERAVDNGIVQTKPLGRLFDLDETKVFNTLPTRFLLGVFRNMETTHSNPNPKVDDLKPFIVNAAKTPTMEKLRQFLAREKYSGATNETTFVQELTKIWLTEFQRGGALKSTAFHHVFIGEFNNARKSIDGLHSWLRYVYLQKTKACQTFHYLGYKQKQKNYLKISFKYGTFEKPAASFFYGTSPVFDFALFSLCYLTRPGENQCKFKMHNGTPDQYEIYVTSVEKILPGNRKCINTVFPCRGNPCT